MTSPPTFYWSKQVTRPAQLLEKENRPHLPLGEAACEEMLLLPKGEGCEEMLADIFVDGVT